MGILLNRRRYMGGGGSSYDENSYIQDGLVFQLDGINKGATDGTWVCLKTGRVFTANNNKYIFPVSNGFKFDYFGDYDYGDTRFRSVMLNSNGLVGTKDWTVEGAGIAYKPTGVNVRTASFFEASNRACGICFNGSYRYANGTYAWVVNNDRSGSIILSLDDSTGMENGIELTEKHSGIGQMTSVGFIVGGAQRWNDNFYGTLHSIRMYNRSLSLEEKLHNQRIDNIRFNLGLSI